MILPPPLILASSSSYRKVALARLGLPFTLASPDLDESPLPGEQPTALTARLAEEKAQKIAIVNPGCVVIGGDQVLAVGDSVLGKPHNASNAYRQLRMLSGRQGIFFTGLAVVRDEFIKVSVTQTAVSWRELSDAEIYAYLRREPSFNCAGSAKIEGLGITLIATFASEDPTALTGVPLIGLAQTLRELGFALP